MAILAYLTLALVCLSAHAAPATKALEDDVAVARSQAVGLDIESLEFANALNIVDLKTDIEVDPISSTIISQLRNLDINNQEVNRIENLFNDSFDLIQEAVRRIERTLRQMREETLSMAIEDLDNSRWNNLRDQRQNLENEANNVDARYDEAKIELSDTLTNLETNLVEALTGQETNAVVEVLSNWQRIDDFFNIEFLGLEDVKVIFRVRADNTLAALDVVLQQV